MIGENSPLSLCYNRVKILTPKKIKKSGFFIHKIESFGERPYIYFFIFGFS
jgi:hypothetical protein